MLLANACDVVGAIEVKRNRCVQLIECGFVSFTPPEALSTRRSVGVG
jgi:hypothetical protein